MIINFQHHLPITSVIANKSTKYLIIKTMYYVDCVCLLATFSLFLWLTIKTIKVNIRGIIIFLCPADQRSWVSGFSTADVSGWSASQVGAAPVNNTLCCNICAAFIPHTHIAIFTVRLKRAGRTGILRLYCPLCDHSPTRVRNREYFCQTFTVTSFFGKLNYFYSFL